MELTKLQKALTISALINVMKEAEIEPDFKPSEGAKMLLVITEELETIPKEKQDEIGIKAIQNAARALYDDLMKGDNQ